VSGALSAGPVAIAALVVVAVVARVAAGRGGAAGPRALLGSVTLAVAACLSPSLSVLTLVGAAVLALQGGAGRMLRAAHVGALLAGAGVLLAAGCPDALGGAPVVEASPWLPVGLGLSLLGWLRAAGGWPLASAPAVGSADPGAAEAIRQLAAVVGLSRLLLEGFGQGGVADPLGGWPPVVGAVGVLGALSSGVRAALADTRGALVGASRGSLLGLSLLAAATGGGLASGEAGRAALWLHLASMLLAEVLLSVAPDRPGERPSLRAGAALLLLSGGPGSPAFAGRVLLFAAVPAWGAPAVALWLVGLGLSCALPWVGAARLIAGGGEPAPAPVDAAGGPK
jgi:hypothetical protein